MTGTKSFRLDPMHEELFDKLMEAGAYRNSTELILRAIRLLAKEKLSQDEINEIIEKYKLEW